MATKKVTISRTQSSATLARKRYRALHGLGLQSLLGHAPSRPGRAASPTGSDGSRRLGAALSFSRRGRPLLARAKGAAAGATRATKEATLGSPPSELLGFAGRGKAR